MTEMTPALIRAQKKYNRTKTKGYALKFNKVTDANCIAKMESVDSKTGYIKKLIREDIKKNSK